MTRINVGVDPKELCDQHLITEYRELPRMWNFVPVSKPPPEFKLKKGHMLWCAQYPGMLADRFNALVKEMRFRNINVNYPEHPPGKQLGARPTLEAIRKARPIVLERINERVKQMEKHPDPSKRPRWTKRKRP